MPPLISFEGASDFTIKDSNFGRVGGDFTTITLNGSDLGSLIPSNNTRQRNQKHRSKGRGRRLQESTAAAPLTPHPPVPLPPARSPASSFARPPDFQFPDYGNDDNRPYYSTPVSSVSRRQPISTPSPPISAVHQHPLDELSPLTDALGLRRFTPSNRSQTTTPRHETQNIPYSEAQSSVYEPKTPHSMGSARTWNSTFERPQNPSPPSFYSYASPPTNYPQHPTRNRNATNFSSAASTHSTASASHYTQSGSSRNPVQSHRYPPAPFMSSAHQVHVTRTQTDLTPASEPKTPTHSTDSVRTWHLPFERPQNPSPPSFYSYASPSFDYPQHPTQNLNTTPNPLSRSRSSAASHCITSPSHNTQFMSPRNSIRSRPSPPAPFLSPTPQVHVTRTHIDVTPAEAVRAHWTALYPPTVRDNSPYDVRLDVPDASYISDPMAADTVNANPRHNNFHLEGSYGFEPRGLHNYHTLYYEQLPLQPPRSTPRSTHPNIHPPNMTWGYIPQRQSSTPPLRYSRDSRSRTVA